MQGRDGNITEAQEESGGIFYFFSIFSFKRRPRRSHPDEMEVETEFLKGEYAVIYGIDTQPQIVKLKKGKLSVTLPTGHGCFVTLL